MRLSTWSNFVVKRFSAVNMPPFGPRLYLSVSMSAPSVARHSMDILLHDLLVIYRVPNVDVGVERYVCNGRVKVECVRR